jgi:hypothetical protein
VAAPARSLRAAVALLAAVAVATLATCLAPARALASDTEQSILMDDDQLIYATPAHVRAVMEQLAALGIDRIKVSMVWSLVAPDPDSTTAPRFQATNPGAYPAGAWARYDRLDELGHRLGIGIYFQLTAPAPEWAVSQARERSGYSWSHEPDPADFQQFVEAVGRRYSGTYVPASAGSQGAGSGLAAPGHPLPRVSWYGIWNEPNEIGWLSPQTRRFDGREVPAAPALYRGLLDAGYAGLAATGHAHDTILIGETASGGQIQPTPFIRDLYCVGPGYRPLRGAAAAALSCPPSPSPAAFVAANPGLFRAAGYAHHPYSFDEPPNVPFRDNPGIVMLGNLGAFERALDRVLEAYGRPGGLPLYLTEWGYKTDPPNPFVKTSLAQQATWLNEGEYMTWKDPRIRALAQFLLVDDLPRASATPGTLAYWSTFQSGLEYASGAPKPAFAAFRLPIWVPHPDPGPDVALWAQLRPADHATVSYGVLEYQPPSPAAAPWQSLDELETTNPEGYLMAHVAIPARGTVRIAWLDPATGLVYYSRSVTIR